MTPQVCILGNSHVAALQTAWALAPGRWPFAARFVAARQDLMGQTAVQGGHLAPTSAATARGFAATAADTSIDLAGFDGFVIVGCAVALPAILPLYRDATWAGLAPDAMPAQRSPISGPAACATAQAIPSLRLGPRLAAMLRRATAAPIMATPQPRISAAILTTPRPDMRLHGLAIQRGDAGQISDLFDAAAASVFGSTDTRYLAQPACTIEGDILTDARFMAGAARLDPGACWSGRDPALQPTTDISHANAAYGAMILDQIAAALGSHQEPGLQPKTACL